MKSKNGTTQPVILVLLLLSLEAALGIVTEPGF